MRKTRVLMLGVSQNIGGVETYIINMLKAMKGENYVFYFPKQDGTLAYEDYLRREHVIISTPVPHRKYWRYKKMWLNIMKEYQFDIVYYNTCDIVSIDLLKIAKVAGITVRIIHAHSTGNQRGAQKKMNLFHRFLEKQNRQCLHKYATNLLACSESAGDWMYDGRDYQIIRNGIQISKFQYDAEKRSRIRRVFGYNGELLLGVIGRLSPEKNCFYALKILEKLLKRENIKAVFIGDGEQRNALQEEVNNLGLQHKIKFVGSVDNVDEWMSAIDCLLMPSLFEGLPFVLVEAQAAGLPCVVSSTVSEEANITGLVTYVAMEEDVEVWGNTIRESIQGTRKDTEQMLIDAGYSTLSMAETVSKLIETEIKQIGKEA